MRRLLVAGCVVLLVGCSSGSDAGDGGDRSTTTATPAATTTEPPEPLEDQTPPPKVNGLTVQGDTLWIASIEGDQVIQIDPESGDILQRYDTEGAGPDDVAVAPDGSVWVTGFSNGDLGRIAEGTYEVMAKMEQGINPLGFDDDGTLYVGTYGPEGRLYLVSDDAGPDLAPIVVADDLPDINAFGILEDGTIIAPAGGVAGPGSAIAIDVVPSGKSTVETVVEDLDPVAAGTTDADGTPYLLANISGKIYEIDVEAGTAEVVRTVTEGAPFDNLAFAEDGTLYLTSFAAPTVTEVAPDGTTRIIEIGG